ncbi:hypothetical protein VPH35_072341 [Triticum aestivum]
MQQVMQLQLSGGTAVEEPPRLFADVPPPVIAAPPPWRPSAPLKSRASSTPIRQSARQAANPSTVPVAQRASLLLVKQLGLLGPKEKMTAEVEEALIRRFDEPLTDDDIEIIAKLTRLDLDALCIAGGLAGPDAETGAAV